MADILHCGLLDVGSRTYRVLSGSSSTLTSHQRGNMEEFDETAVNDGGFWDEDAADEGADDPSITPDGASGGFRTEISLDSEVGAVEW